MNVEDPDDQPADENDMAKVRRVMHALSKAPSSTGHSPRRTAETRYADLESWVHEFFVLTFTSHARRKQWCGHWWDHPEAVLRLDVLWRTWETEAQRPERMSAWLREHLDPALAGIFHPQGPFADCRDGVHRRVDALPTVPPPPALAELEPRHWWELPNELPAPGDELG